MRQYITVKFRKDERRSYTYHNDGPPVAVGDRVKVPGRKEGTSSELEVFGIVDQPEFDTKAILGKVEPEQRDLLASAGEWRPFQPGDAIPRHGMFEVHYRADIEHEHMPETMPADRINWQHVSRFRSVPDAPASAPGQA